MENRDPEYGGSRMWRLPDMEETECGNWVLSNKKETSAKNPVDF